jgi:hypothetical protein
MLWFLLLALQGPVLADSYLDEIQAEASHLEVLGKAKREQQQLRERIDAEKAKPPPVPKPARQVVAASKPSGVDRTAFEKELRKEFPSSYGLYALLTPQQKDAVVKEFESSGSAGFGRFLSALTMIVNFSIGRQ